jgi:hypothetical protein
MRKLNFKTKNEYLQYIKDWKLDYRILSEDIRDKKKADKLHQRYYSQSFLIHWVNGSGTSWNDKYKKTIDECKDRVSRDNWLVSHDKRFNKKHGEWCYRLTLSEIATNMLAELKLAKQESQRQYMEENQLVTI